MQYPTPEWLEKKKLSHVIHVCDIETFDTAPTSKVASLALVTVDLLKLEITDHLYVTISCDDQIDRTLSKSTVEFWQKQKEESPEAWAEIFDNKGKMISLEDALEQVQLYIDENTPTGTRAQVMGNGSEFDNVILTHCFEQFDIKVPWSFRGNQSLRTVVLLGQLIAGVDPRDELEFKGHRHHALHDAQHEAECLIEVFKRLAKSNVDIEQEQQDMFHASLVRALGKPKGCDVDLVDLLVEVQELREQAHGKSDTCCGA